MKQEVLDFRKIIVVPNCWGPVYYLQYDDHRTVQLDDLPECFWSIDEALSFAEASGIAAEVPESTRMQYSHWTPEQLAKYRMQCRSNND